MAVKEKKREVELRRGNTPDKLKEYQEDWETEEGLREFLRFVRGEDTPDSLRKSLGKEMDKP